MRHFVSLLFVAACSGDTGEAPAPPEAASALGLESGRSYRVVATSDQELDIPRDLAFSPAYPNQLWVMNRATDSATIIFDAGTDVQSSEWRDDSFGSHFMDEVSSLAFTDANHFATCQESANGGDYFMGPALWDADLDVFASVYQNGFGGNLGSHLDMLHQSPYCMGIANQQDNVFWVMDGYHGHIVRYDFQDDHGPGQEDHADGIVHFFVEAEVSYVPDVPSHMEVDRDSGWLYYTDTASGRVMRLDTASGGESRGLPLNMEYLEDFAEWDGATIETVADGLSEPSGLAISGGLVYVGDHGTGEIIVYDLDGTEVDRAQTPADSLMGLEIGPNGRVWYVDGARNEVVLIDTAG